jgi:hypothetical protein
MDTIQIFTGEEAKAAYQRLCKKAVRLHQRSDSDEGPALFSVCQALSNDWDLFCQNGLTPAELKHLKVEDRAAVLRLLETIIQDRLYQGVLDPIWREACSVL